MIRVAGAVLCAALLALGPGCRPARPPISAATLRASELPADLPALRARSQALFAPADLLALENQLVVCDRILELAPGDFEAAWQWARAAFWLADAAGAERERRAWFSQRGAEHAELAVAAQPRRVEGHYYRGVNLGYLARSRTVGALELLQPIYKSALAALGADEAFDHAGPLRLLGGVLINAPSWPASVGDPDEGVERLARAVQLAPEFPLNHLLYGEALLKVDRAAEAEAQLLLAEQQLDQPAFAFLKPRVIAELHERLARARR